MIAKIRNDNKFVINNDRKKQSKHNAEGSSKFHLYVL